MSRSDGSIEKANALYIGLLAEEIKNDEYLEANRMHEIERREKLLQLEQEKELNRLQVEKEKEMKKLIDPRFKDPQPFLKKKH
ncbi:hypothetical protein [Acinetobacter gyllenbergii]|uniref:hypothetical protein n=1 Tax=Acinetobacter gyllenbergii TaxID=134534 RepID=UPI003F55D636